VEDTRTCEAWVEVRPKTFCCEWSLLNWSGGLFQPYLGFLQDIPYSDFDGVKRVARRLNDEFTRELVAGGRRAEGGIELSLRLRKVFDHNTRFVTSSKDYVGFVQYDLGEELDDDTGGIFSISFHGKL
jgi:hypothetical protein